MSFHEAIPDEARLNETQDQVVWMNNKGQHKQREVVGDRVYIRQQPPLPPKQPEILLLADQMLEGFQVPDKYFHINIMVGYSLQDFINDMRDSAFDHRYPYIMVFLGSLQLGRFDSRAVHRQVAEFMKIVDKVTPNSLVLFSGLVPRPVDFPKSKIPCENYTRVYSVATQDLAKKVWKCSTIPVFEEFINKKGLVEDPLQNFDDGLYLTNMGMRKLCAAWLRHLGYFPKK